jgi:hypothetical protein
MIPIKTACMGLLVLATLVAALFMWKYTEWVEIPKARASLVALLKDPGSAQFRNERIDPTGALCGEVNAKNAMGAYVGFKKYVSFGSEANFVEGTGQLGKASTADYVEWLDRKTELVKTHTRWRKEGVEVPNYSDSELNDQVRDSRFDAKWTEFCGIDRI